MSRLLKVEEYAERAALGRSAAYASLERLPPEAVIRIGRRIRIDWALARKALAGDRAHASGAPPDGEADMSF